MNGPKKKPPSGDPDAAAARLFDACQKPLQLPDAARPVALLAARARAYSSEALEPPSGMPPEHARAALSAVSLGDPQRADEETRRAFAELSGGAQRLAFIAASLARPALALGDCAVAYVDDTRPRLEIYISGAGAEKAVPSANRSAAVWNLTMPREARFVHDDGSRTYYLRGGDTMQAAAYKALLTMRMQMKRREQDVKQELSAPNVHQFRVVSRRLRSVLQTFRSALGKETLRPLEKAARVLGRASNETRELDTLLLRLQGYECPHLQQRAAEERDRSAEGLSQTMSGGALEQLDEAYEALLMALHPVNRVIERVEAQLTLRLEAPRLIKRHLNDLIQLGENIGAADMDRLHVLRIASKRFRYSMETLSEILPKKVRNLLIPLTEFQDILGEDRDALLQEEYIGHFLKDNPTLLFEEKRALGQLCAELRRKQTKARSEFMKRWTLFAARNKENP